MATFKNLDDLYKEIKKNPLKYTIGQTFKEVCPVCKEQVNIKVISNNKLQCLNCNEEFKVDQIKWN